MKVVYLSSSHGTIAARNFNTELVSVLVAGYDESIAVIMPQLFEGGILDMVSQCREGVELCDVVLAIVDAPDAEASVAFEIGLASAFGKEIVVVRTDWPTCKDNGYGNLMITACATTLIFEQRDATIRSSVDLIREALLPGVVTFHGDLDV